MKALLFVWGFLLTVPDVTAQPLVVTPQSLTFTSTVNSPDNPPAQTLQLTSTGGNIAFRADVVILGAPYPPEPPFLTVSPLTGTTPATLTVGLVPNGLAPGNHYQSVFIFGPSSILEVGVTAKIGPPSPPTITSVVNAASLQSGPVSPGEIISIMGTSLGWGLWNSTVQGTPPTTVTFDGVPAPLLYVDRSQVNAIVPYEIPGKTTTNMIVSFFKVDSTPVRLPVADTTPAVFSLNYTGSGQGAIFNEDFSANSMSKPAAKGSVVQIFGTGAGATDPPAKTGAGNCHVDPRFPPPCPIPVAPVSLTIGGTPAQITYAGQAPIFIAGLMQVNAVVPEDIGSGPQPVVLTIGNNSNSAQQITVAVK